MYTGALFKTASTAPTSKVNSIPPGPPARLSLVPVATLDANAARGSSRGAAARPLPLPIYNTTVHGSTQAEGAGSSLARLFGGYSSAAALPPATNSSTISRPLSPSAQRMRADAQAAVGMDQRAPPSAYSAPSSSYNYPYTVGNRGTETPRSNAM